MRRDALQSALYLSSRPQIACELRQLGVPSNIKFLFEILADDTEATDRAARSSGLEPQELRRAAEEFVVQILAFPGASAYRVLGADNFETRETLRIHFTLLSRWLHPDVSHQHSSELYERIVKAWAIVGSARARGLYDQELLAALRHETGGPPVVRAPFFETQMRPPSPAMPLFARNSRRLLGAAAIACLLVLVWYLIDDEVFPHLLQITTAGEF